jgi:transcription antitermination factor NusG
MEETKVSTRNSLLTRVTKRMLVRAHADGTERGEALPDGIEQDVTAVGPISYITSDTQAQWYCIQTRPRHEKKVNEDLQSLGFSTYLPLMDQIHQWSDRRQSVEVPLFPRYLFLRSEYTAQVHHAVIRRWGVNQFVGIRGIALPIPDHEIASIEILLRRHVPVEPHPFLKVGERVRCKGGALDGLEGILVAKNRDYSLVVSIELLQRSLAVRIEGYDLELVKQ